MNNSAPKDSFSWYAICTHPKQEERATRNLRAWDITTFAPQIKEPRYNPVTGRRQYTTKYLFPRYIFARFNVESSIQKIRFTRGIHSIVSCGNDPVPVQENIIDTIKERIGREGYVLIHEKLNPGDRVRIKDGAMKDFVGVFEHALQDQDRVRILLTTINYQMHIEVEISMVSKM